MAHSTLRLCPLLLAVGVASLLRVVVLLEGACKDTQHLGPRPQGPTHKDKLEYQE